MSTPALTIPELARLMSRYAAAAWDEDLRCSGDTDEVLLGKLTMLDVICDPIWISDRQLSAGEERELGAAREELGSAWDYLSGKTKGRATRATRATASGELQPAH